MRRPFDEESVIAGQICTNATNEIDFRHHHRNQDIFSDRGRDNDYIDDFGDYNRAIHYDDDDFNCFREGLRDNDDAESCHTSSIHDDQYKSSESEITDIFDFDTGPREGNRSEQHLYHIDLNHVLYPQSMFDDDENFYDADDEYDFIARRDVKDRTSIQQDDGGKENQDESLLKKTLGNIEEKYFIKDGNNNEDSEYELNLHYRDSYQRRESSKTSHGQYENSSQDVIHRIEAVIGNLINYLNRMEGPILHQYKRPQSTLDSTIINPNPDPPSQDLFLEISKENGEAFKCFDNVSLQRVFTSITLVMSFIHLLLISNRTTTTREVYYVFVTHFRSQKECDAAILDVAKILGVPRRALGLSASPKGWFCGSVKIIRRGTLPSGTDVSGSIDGTALSSIQGLTITREWIERDEYGFTEDGVQISVKSKNAKFIVVVEKEGVYNRLAEERIFDEVPCILVTGKGFPDLATRALVKTLCEELDLPVLGLCDCNPYGISVLALYHCAGDRMGVDGNMTYSVPIKWIGLRPTEVARLEDKLPKQVFQKLTDLDQKRIDALLDETHKFLNENREDEILLMQDNGYKVELEALYWLGPDYMGKWVVDMLRRLDDKNETCSLAI